MIDRAMTFPSSVWKAQVDVVIFNLTSVRLYDSIFEICSGGMCQERPINFILRFISLQFC